MCACMVEIIIQKKNTNEELHRAKRKSKVIVREKKGFINRQKKGKKLEGGNRHKRKRKYGGILRREKEGTVKANKE